jgi:RNA polymerase sigma factor
LLSPCFCPELDNLLGEYGIKFEELENLSPKHRDTREILNRMALDFIKDKELVDELIKKRRFPAAAFVKKSGYNIKSVEKHRKYLITLIIINLHPEWMHLASYAKIK